MIVLEGLFFMIQYLGRGRATGGEGEGRGGEGWGGEHVGACEGTVRHLTWELDTVAALSRPRQ